MAEGQDGIHTPPINANCGAGNIRTKVLQREQIITNIHTMKTNINDLFEMSVYQLEVKLSLLERQLNSFERLQLELESLDESEISHNHRFLMEDAYYEVKSVILERLAHHRGQNSELPLSSTRVAAQPSNSIQPVLPTLQLSKFNGDYMDWMEFYSVFCLLVHDNQNLPSISKFQYLKSCLTGSAARLIQSLEVTPDNYEVAFDLLKTRFNNKKQLFQSHLLEIFNIKKVMKPNVNSLRLFVDKINSSMRALESIATQQQISDNIILHLIVSKLDSNLQVKWEESQFQSLTTITSSFLQLPTWDDLAKFLENRCKSLEICESIHTTSSKEPQSSRPSQYKTSHIASPKFQTTSYVLSKQQARCLLCNTAPTHNVIRCKKFIDMTVYDRFKAAKQLKLCLNCLGTNHIANSCPSLNRCQKCSGMHHTLLHKEKIVSERVSSEDLTIEDGSPTSCLQSSQENSPAILATAVVELCTSNGTSLRVRALLDSCSQSNFITERMAQHMRLQRKKVNINISGIGDTNRVHATHMTTLTAKSLTSGYFATFNAIIISSISSCHPQQHIDIRDWNIPPNIKLADQHFNKPSPIDLLIGVDLFWDLLMVGKIKVDGQPNFIKTKLGWIVAGSSDSPKEAIFSANSTTNSLLVSSQQQTSLSNEPLLDEWLQSFWTIENCERELNSRSTEENECEKLFENTTKRCPLTNKFIVRLPFKETPPSLGESRQIALRRFTYLESRLSRDKLMEKEYNEFLAEYLSLRHMEQTTMDNALNYIPHHCVVKPESSTTRLRVVFDASCITTNGKSLNDLLHVGPTLQDDVFTILTRFRFHKFVLVADIAKMYRQILVDNDDRKYQCILWRKNNTDPLHTYELQTVTYGTSCAPYLAVKCLQQLAKVGNEKYPIGSRVTMRDFYVDNLMTGGKTEEEVIEIKRQVVALLNEGGFPLRKFASNSESILRDVNQTEREIIIKVDNREYIKTLGLKWSPVDDVFYFSFPAKLPKQNITKRSILSQMASFFDPLGFINPLIVRCKILMQELWKLKLHWDESVPYDISFEWKQICDDLSSIGQIKIQRYVIFNTHTQIHLFVDASKRAYGACIYVVTRDINNNKSQLLCAKSRVAPTKEVSIPRLELCAALLGSQLLQSVRDYFPVSPTDVHCWSDSMITLSWIAGEAYRWPTFVSNRVAKIKLLTSQYSWRYVPSELNPADLLSRGSTVVGLKNPVWLHGPDFLQRGYKCWPEERRPDVQKECDEFVATLITTKFEDVISQHKYVNSYGKLLRIFAYVRRFINACKRQGCCKGALAINEMNDSLLLICKGIQHISFWEEIKSINSEKPLNNHSKLRQLSPFLHNGVLRVGGRLKNSSLAFTTKHPILLPRSHPFVTTIINYFHQKHLHAGPLTLHNILRDKFWIINARNAIKGIVHKCIRCYRCRPIIESQVMGSLPAHRVEQSYPFNISGVDYCGPFSVSSQIRGRGPKKVFLAIFICFSVKAVHLELVPDLTSLSFIGALKRFISRRGHCSIIYSDNATNFVGASKELRNMLQDFLSEAHSEMVQKACEEEGITWKFIPPRSPHFGGLWESAVKQAKHYIRHTIGNLVLTFDDLHTICCQTEAIINSRPLTPLSSDPNDLRPLTPGHFLVGRLLTTMPEPAIVTDNPVSLKRYHIVQWIQQQFWNRWRNEYLKVLQIREKWTTTKSNLQVNDLVLLKEENTPPLKWPLARVIECNPGNDDVVRVVSVKTAAGVFKRAITNLCKLPLNH